MADVASVNGKIAPAAESCISVLDRSFLFGDGVYETLRTYSGRPYLLESHLQRLAESARRLAIPATAWLGGLAGEIARTLAAGANDESVIRVVITRGEGMIEADPRAVPGPPNVVILVRPLRAVPPEIYRDGTAAVLVGVRRNAIESLDPRIKSNNLLNNLLASMEAHRRGAPEAILLTAGGEIAEGSNTNVFLVQDGALHTPSLETGILDGITRSVVLELAREAGLQVSEARLPASALERVEELFLTSTTREILPVVRLDGRPVAGGRPGPITVDLHRRYRERAAAFAAS